MIVDRWAWVGMTRGYVIEVQCRSRDQTQKRDQPYIISVGSGSIHFRQIVSIETQKGDAAAKTR